MCIYKFYIAIQHYACTLISSWDNYKLLYQTQIIARLFFVSFIYVFNFALIKLIFYSYIYVFFFFFVTLIMMQ